MKLLGLKNKKIKNKNYEILVVLLYFYFFAYCLFLLNSLKMYILKNKKINKISN